MSILYSTAISGEFYDIRRISSSVYIDLWIKQGAGGNTDLSHCDITVRYYYLTLEVDINPPLDLLTKILEGI
jgi:hypothetical protein